MCSLFVQAGHIQEWIETHQALVCAFPWFPSRPERAIRVHRDAADLWEQVARTPVGTHEHAFFAWTRDQPGVIAPLRLIIGDLDVLTWDAAGWRFFCGAQRELGEWTLVPHDFGAYAGGDHLTLRSG